LKEIEERQLEEEEENKWKELVQEVRVRREGNCPQSQPTCKKGRGVRKLPHPWPTTKRSPLKRKRTLSAKSPDQHTHATPLRNDKFNTKCQKNRHGKN
jgi:hypothetical protein